MENISASGQETQIFAARQKNSPLSGRDYFIDFWRFLASLIIMTYHSHMVLGNYPHPFGNGWIYVEFFLILSGYYTTRHFARHNNINNNINNFNHICREAFFYTIHKFHRYLPYAAVSTVALAMIKPMNINQIESMALDMLLLTQSFGHMSVIPLWYLSAMFLAFPIFCVLAQWQNQYGLLIFSFSFPVIYYGQTGIAGDSTSMADLLRAFSGLLLGAFVFHLSDILRESRRNDPGRVRFRDPFVWIEMFCLLYPLWRTWHNAGNDRFLLVCFVTGLSFHLSGSGGISNTRFHKPLDVISRFTGRLSLPMFAFHWTVGEALSHFNVNFPEKIWAFYLITILLAILAVLLDDWIKIRRRKNA